MTHGKASRIGEYKRTSMAKESTETQTTFKQHQTELDIWRWWSNPNLLSINKLYKAALAKKSTKAEVDRRIHVVIKRLSSAKKSS